MADQKSEDSPVQVALSGPGPICTGRGRTGGPRNYGAGGLGDARRRSPV